MAEFDLFRRELRLVRHESRLDSTTIQSRFDKDRASTRRKSEHDPKNQQGSGVAGRIRGPNRVESEDYGRIRTHSMGPSRGSPGFC